MTAPVLSPALYRLLAPTRSAEDDLSRLLCAFTAGERRAFWSAVFIVDGKVTVRALLERAVAVREPAPPPPSNVIPLSGRTCADCGDPLPVRAKSMTGPAPRFCARCRGRRENDARKTRRARPPVAEPAQPAPVPMVGAPEPKRRVRQATTVGLGGLPGQATLFHRQERFDLADDDFAKTVEIGDAPTFDVRTPRAGSS